MDICYNWIYIYIYIYSVYIYIYLSITIIISMSAANLYHAVNSVYADLSASFGRLFTPSSTRCLIMADLSSWHIEKPGELHLASGYDYQFAMV